MRSLLDRAKATRAILAILAVVLLLSGAWLYGVHRWNSETRELRARVDAAREPDTSEFSPNFGVTGGT